ncbi:MAG: hypothetical protein EXR50_03915 [Dehalococcoidia bacterium]|nr:hypothetical protein [Dehalococcoidia bacterium]
MFATRTTFVPIPGKAPELRALLEERMNAKGAHGAQSSSVQSRMFGPDGMSFDAISVYPDLAAYQQFMSKRDPDPAFKSWQAKIHQVVSAPTTQQLTESVVTAPATMARGKFYQRAIRVPILWKGPELRSVLEEHVKGRQSRGVRAHLWSQMFGASGPAFVVNVEFPSLAAYEDDLKSRVSDPAHAAIGAEYNRKLLPLQSSARTQLWEVVARSS